MRLCSRTVRRSSLAVTNSSGCRLTLTLTLACAVIAGLLRGAVNGARRRAGGGAGVHRLPGGRV